MDLGRYPLANAFKRKAGETDLRVPLHLMFCRDCHLLQIKETVAKEVLFDSYIWVSGTSLTARRYAGRFLRKIQSIVDIRPNDLVVEVGSNDGTFLKPFLEKGCRVRGVEPARNVSRLAEQNGVATLTAYWNPEVARGIISREGHPRVIIARHVITHASELHDVVEGISLGLADDGIGAIEFYYAGDVKEGLQYDYIYHEHLCHFTVDSLASLLERHHLAPFAFDGEGMCKGSCILYFAKTRRKAAASYHRILAQENIRRVNRETSWRKFAARCFNHRDKTLRIVQRYRGARVVGFGASARGATFLNFCGLTAADIQAIIDNNRLKQKLYIPGVSIPVVSMKEGLRSKPDVIMILAWNYKDEIVRECRRAGYRGEYVVFFPGEPRRIDPKEAVRAG